ncbi:unnamed protein product [Leptidea sinapis]|uniref:Uncharacterized protein n=1 Tax=Leptidea sinapis TaxID=189913 RepID=A0A5E4R0A6_9NEOP|nr:unnamed protein product [Leptidea sinapis]
MYLVQFVRDALSEDTKGKESLEAFADKKLLEDHSAEFPNHYDAVVSSEMDLFVKSCVDALKPGGRIVITAPSKTLLAKLHLIVLLEDIVKIIPKGLHEYDNRTCTRKNVLPLVKQMEVGELFNSVLCVTSSQT